MITTNDERLVEQATKAVKLLVTILRVKLFIQNRVWRLIANMCEAIIINVAGTLIDALPALALMA
jgi:hypothetical protein